MRLSDGFHGKTAIALFDILGFRQIVRSIPLDRLAELVKRVDGVAAGARVSADDVGSMVFSDTIVLYANPNLLDAGMGLIAVSSSNLINSFARVSIPLRGALTFGEIFVDPKRNQIAGRALIRAYELEQSQEWCGAVVDEDLEESYLRAIQASPQPEDLVMFEAPMKTGPVRPYACVNWVHRFAHTGGDPKAIFGQGVDGDHAVLRKYINTRRFYDFVVGS